MAQGDGWLLPAILNPDDLVGRSNSADVPGASFANVLAARTRLAFELQDWNRHADAEPILLGVLALRQQILGAGHPHTLETAAYYVASLCAMRRYDEAEVLCNQLLEILEVAPGWQARWAYMATTWTANVLIAKEKIDEAGALYRRMIARCEPVLGPESEIWKSLKNDLEYLEQVRARAGPSALVEEIREEISPSSEPPKLESNEYVVRSYQRALQHASIVAERMQLITGDRKAAAHFATSRNAIELGFPTIDDLLDIPEIDVPFPICSVCASANPWWRETAGGFSLKIVAGTPEYVREVDAADMEKSAEERGCFTCRLMSLGLKAYSQMIHSSSEEWKKRVKIRVKGSPEEATLCVGASKSELVQFFILPGQEVPCAAIGRANHTSTETLAALDGVSQLLKQCIKSHSECGGDELVKLPTRLIEVGQSNDKLRLAETAGGKGMYATLSYCWGETGEAAKTLAGNIAGRLTKLPFSDLGKTHQDAIEITRNLGLQYLWIDSICIIQGDPADWEKESSQMADIYRNSTITIAAAQSTHAQGGILLDRPDKSSKPGILRFQPDGTDREIFYRQPVMSHQIWSNCITEQSFNLSQGDMDCLPLENRAWCLQERMLSRRIVHFAQEEFFFECWQGRRCECGEIGGRQNSAGAPTLRDDFKVALETSSQKERSHIWMGIVAECTRRGIKHQSDRLPALSGIAQRLHNGGHGQYLAGMWRLSLPNQILWTVDDYFAARRAQTSNAPPSWSWASTENSGISFHIGSSDSGEFYMIIKEASCVPSSIDTFGNVKGGTIQLEAPLVRAKMGWYRSLDRESKDLIAFGNEAADSLGFKRPNALQLKMDPVSASVKDFRPDFPLLNPETDSWIKGQPDSNLTNNDPKGTKKQNEASSPQSHPTSEMDVAIIVVHEQKAIVNSQSYRLSCLVLRQQKQRSMGGKYERIGLLSVKDENFLSNYFDITKRESIEIA